MLKDARERLKLERVLAITDQDNEASIKLLQKLGLQIERVIKMSTDSAELFLPGYFSLARSPDTRHSQTHR